MAQITDEELAVLRKKAEKWDKLNELLDSCYEEDSTSDLADIGEKVVTFTGHLYGN